MKKQDRSESEQTNTEECADSKAVVTAKESAPSERADSSAAPVGDVTAENELLPAQSTVPSATNTAYPPMRAAEPLYTEDRGDDSMSGGYASVNGKSVRFKENRMVWIVLAVMVVMCIAVGICSSIITAHFMRSGEKPPVINTDGNVQQNIAAVVDGRKSCIVEVDCNGMRGSGVIMKLGSGTVYVMTNTHVITNYINYNHYPTVRFYGEDGYYQAAVAGYDPHYDIAVLSVSMSVADMRDFALFDLDGSDYFKPDVAYAEGDYVVSIGNAMGLGIAVYDGIISRKSEILECDELFDDGKKSVPVMRTTAAVNAGMSGGALFDMNGNFIGLGTYRMTNSTNVNGNEGTAVEDTAFVTPVSIVYPVYKRIMSEANGGAVPLFDIRLRKTNTSAIGWVGLPLGFDCEYRKGRLTVVALDVGSPSSSVEVGDIITDIGGVKLTDDLCATVGALLGYKRGGSGNALSVKIEHNGAVRNINFDNYRYAI